MRVLWINNDGSGFADHVDVKGGTTIEKFLAEKLSGHDPTDFLIRVNRQPVARDQILREGDRVTATPIKVEGALAGIAPGGTP